MRKTERLIEEARLSTNIDSSDAVSDQLCVLYLNRIQSHIQDIITNTNTESRFFKGYAIFNIISGYDTYQLPHDTYNRNAVHSVQVRYSSGSNYSYSSMKRISEKRRGQDTGYFTYDDKLVLTPIPLTSDTIVVSYQKKLPKMSLLIGEIVDITGNVITYTSNIGTQLITKFDDYFCTTDSYDKIITYKNKITSCTDTTIVCDDVTGMVVGQKIVAGEYSSNISMLPDECEKILILMLERMMLGRLSSKDIQVSTMFTSEILDNIKTVFQENNGDVFTPPVVEFSEWM